MSARREQNSNSKNIAGTRRELWQPDNVKDDKPTGRLTWIRAELIDPNPHQPRKTLDRAALEELKASIAEQGILQPLLVVREKPQNPNADTRYILIAGQRRLSAARELGKKMVPVFILSEADPQGSLLNAITENVQRRALAPWEEGESYRTLATEFNMTHAEIAQRLGKGNESGRVYVAERIAIAENLDPEARRILLNQPSISTLLENSQSVAQATLSDFLHNEEPGGELSFGVGVIRELSRIPRDRQKEAAEAIRKLEGDLKRKPSSNEVIKLLKSYRGVKLQRRGGGNLPLQSRPIKDRTIPAEKAEQPFLPGLENGQKNPAINGYDNKVLLGDLEVIRRWKGGLNQEGESINREELITLLRHDLEKLEGGHEETPR
jgi:ParB/RepB/Spo0J family partition protein